MVMLKSISIIDKNDEEVVKEFLAAYQLDRSQFDALYE
jgi:hypothetical protein